MKISMLWLCHENKIDIILDEKDQFSPPYSEESITLLVFHRPFNLKVRP